MSNTPQPKSGSEANRQNIDKKDSSFSIIIREENKFKIYNSIKGLEFAFFFLIEIQCAYDHISRTRSQVGFLSSPLISRIFFLSFKLSQKNHPNETPYVESIKHVVSISSYIPLSYD